MAASPGEKAPGPLKSSPSYSVLELIMRYLASWAVRVVIRITPLVVAFISIGERLNASAAALAHTNRFFINLPFYLLPGERRVFAFDPENNDPSNNHKR